MNLKGLGMGVLFVVLVGIAGFLYRNALTRPVGIPIHCAPEEKACPDGSVVGRSGPDCAFAPCPLP